MRCYTAEEIEAIRSRYPTEGARQLAKDLDRHPRNVSSKAAMLGVCCQAARRNGRSAEWTEEMDRTLRREWPLLFRRQGGKTVAQLASRWGLTKNQVYYRAAHLGLRRMKIKEPCWSEEELEILNQCHHLTPQIIKKRLQKAGYARTQTAIVVQRNRRHYAVTDGVNAYSAHGLARLMGVECNSILRWINRGLLKAVPRGDSMNTSGGPGDRWIIAPKSARAFIVANVALIDLALADRYWLIDLLAGGDYAEVLQPSQRAESCGVRNECTSGFQEAVCRL